jgi:hypothetical protein
LNLKKFVKNVNIFPWEGGNILRLLPDKTGAYNFVKFRQSTFRAKGKVSSICPIALRVDHGLVGAENKSVKGGIA